MEDFYRRTKKAKVALEAVRGLKTINEIGQEYGVHPTQVSQWKKDLLASLKASAARSQSTPRATQTGSTPK